ncbi:MAG: hypothetical protein O7B24_13580 [Alphaproteobacteria bacterium]|nr:hypothetical protein [Alphaproteobacteria bacterium]
MSDETVGRVHWSFWAIGAVALIWNAMGVMNFFMQMNADTLASFPESQRAIIEGRPTWATAGFAMAVFGGALGCLLLLLRKSAAFYLFVASLLGVIVTSAYTLGMAGSTTDFSPFEIVMIILMPLVVAAFLIWYSKRAGNKGWIGQEQSVSH